MVSIHPAKSLSAQYSLFLKIGKAALIQGSVYIQELPELTVYGAESYKELIRRAESAKTVWISEAVNNVLTRVDLENWIPLFLKKFDDSAKTALEPYLGEIFYRARALYFGKEAIGLGKIKFKDWKENVYSYLSEQEVKQLTPYLEQIYRLIPGTDEATIISDEAQVLEDPLIINSKQRTIIIAGIILMIAMLLLPPWSTQAGLPREYGIIFYPPKPSYVIDLTRLCLQALIVLFITAGAIFILNERREEQNKK